MEREFLTNNNLKNIKINKISLLQVFEWSRTFSTLLLPLLTKQSFFSESFVWFVSSKLKTASGGNGPIK